MKYFRRSRRRTYRRANRMKLRRKAQAMKFLKRYNLPNTVKYLGMSQVKHRILRTSYTAMGSNINGNGPYAFQILLDPMLSQDINQIFDLNATVDTRGNQKYFKYDYMKIKRICISIRPISSKPTAAVPQAVQGADPVYIDENCYAYFTYKFPTFAGELAQAQIAYSYFPTINNTRLEGKYKELYSWNYSKPMLFTFRKLKWVSSETNDRVNANSLINLQYVRRVSNAPTNILDITPILRGEEEHSDLEFENENENNNENNMEENEEDRGVNLTDTNIDLPSVEDAYSNINFGRLILFLNNRYKFNVEVLYDAYFYR